MSFAILTRSLAIVVCVVAFNGCSLMPDAMQPHRLRTLNYHPQTRGEEAYLSIGDLPSPAAESFREPCATLTPQQMLTQPTTRTTP